MYTRTDEGGRQLNFGCHIIHNHELNMDHRPMKAIAQSTNLWKRESKRKSLWHGLGKALLDSNTFYLLKVIVYKPDFIV